MESEIQQQQQKEEEKDYSEESQAAAQVFRSLDEDLFTSQLVRKSFNFFPPSFMTKKKQKKNK